MEKLPHSRTNQHTNRPGKRQISRHLPHRGYGSANQPPAFGHLDYVLALLTAILALVLYLRTLAPGLLGGDSGEFQFAAWLGGIVHPTGYPLYLILGYLWSHLLWAGDPAWRVNVFSALWGAVAVGIVYLLTLRVLDVGLFAVGPASRLTSRLLALLAALTFGVTPTFWSQAVIAEVYTLHAVFVAAVLLGLVAWAGQPPASRTDRPLYWTAAIYGLSLTHHRTTLLLAPAIAVFLWHSRAWGAAGRPRLSGLVKVLLLLLAPLLLYLYIPLRAPHTPYAEVVIGPGQALQLYEPTVWGFIEHITGRVFSPVIRPFAEASAQLLPGARLLIQEVSWAGVIAGLLGLLWLARYARPLWSLIGLSFLAIVGFNLFYGIGDIFVFYIPAYLIWTVWMALGVGALVRQIGAWANTCTLPTHHAPGITPLLVRLFPCLIAFALPAWLLLARYDQLDQSRNTQARATWEAILAQPIPQDAILVSNDRDEMTPLLYLQHVEGIRPDLTGLFPLILPADEWADVGRVVDAVQRSKRPVFLIKPMPGLEVKFRLEPAGWLARVLGPAAAQAPEQPLTIIYADAIQLTGYDLRPEVLAGGETATLTLYWQPFHRLDVDYTTFVHLVDATGARIAQSDHRPGGVYYPTSLWRPAETLADTHILALPPDLDRPPYAIVVGLYTGTTDLRHLGQPQRIDLK
jgi:hypothetical protein